MDVQLSQKAKSLKLGIYKHYKGKKYQVLGVAIHSETLEELVIYKALYGNKLTWVRPINMFLGTVKVDGKQIPRFEFVKKINFCL